MYGSFQSKEISSRLGIRNDEGFQLMVVTSHLKIAIGVQRCNGSEKRVALLQIVANVKILQQCAVLSDEGKRFPVVLTGRKRVLHQTYTTIQVSLWTQLTQYDYWQIWKASIVG